MSREKDFLNGKRSALEHLTKAFNAKQVDSGIQPILDIINNSDEYYSTSSCFGRIVLLEIPTIGNKKEAKFLGKWHRKIKSGEIWMAAKKAKVGILWLLAQSPILHIGVNAHAVADNLLKTAIACGFKNSGAKSIGRKIIVEVCSTERLDSPIGKDGKLFCNEEYLGLMVNIANEIIERSNLKLRRFEEELEKYLSTRKTTQQ